MRLITVKMSELYVNGIDKLVEMGHYPSRSEVIRVAIRDLLMRELWIDGSPPFGHSEQESG
ncbi:MAG: ribbon-helix-helix domain-containing protein [Candidatus Thorarchaeota archaeon]